jgi:hypothetical protein
LWGSRPEGGCDVFPGEKRGNQAPQCRIEKCLELSPNAVLFLGKQEMPFRGHNESSDSLNKGNYRELLECFAE